MNRAGVKALICAACLAWHQGAPGAPFSGDDVGVSISNETPTKTPAKLQIEPEPPGAEEAWSPDSDSLLKDMEIPKSASIPEGIEAQAFEAPFELGKIFFSPEGEAYVFSCQKDKQTLLRMDLSGYAFAHATAEALAGVNRKAGATTPDGAILLTIGSDPSSGNRLGGLYELQPDGSFSEWKLDPRLGGLSDILPASGGGWWLADYEHDNVWRLEQKDAKLKGLLKKDIPGGLMALARGAAPDRSLYALNCADGRGPLSGKPGVYRIHEEEGEAVLIAEPPQGKNFSDIAAGQGKAFGVALYAAEPDEGVIYRIAHAQKAPEPWLTGIPRIGDLEVNPLTKDMLAVFNGRCLLWLKSAAPNDAGADESPAAGQTSSEDSQDVDETDSSPVTAPEEPALPMAPVVEAEDSQTQAASLAAQPDDAPYDTPEPEPKEASAEAAPASWSSHTVNGVSVSIPKGWQTLPGSSTVQAGWYLGEAKSPEASLAVMRIREPEQLSRGMKIERKEKIQVGGQSAWLTAGTKASSRVWQVVLERKLFSDGMARVLIAGSPLEYWEIYEPVYERFLRTASVKAAPAPPPRASNSRRR